MNLNPFESSPGFGQLALALCHWVLIGAFRELSSGDWLLWNCSEFLMRLCFPPFQSSCTVRLTELWYPASFWARVAYSRQLSLHFASRRLRFSDMLSCIRREKLTDLRWDWQLDLMVKNQGRPGEIFGAETWDKKGETANKASSTSSQVQASQDQPLKHS